jgi:hypothetical protein
MTILSGGNVGIGTTAPAAALNVWETANYSPSLTYGSSTGTIFNLASEELAFGTISTSPYAMWMQVRQATNAAGVLAINPLGGNVGIGSTSPSVALDVSQKTDAVALPVGTTGQRPTAAAGQIRYNSTLSNAEIYQGTTASWNTVPGTVARVDVTGQSATIAATTMITPTTSDFYQFCYQILTTTAGTSGTLTVNLYTQSEGGAITWSLGSLTVTSAPSATSGCGEAFAMSGTAIQYGVTFAGTKGSLAYTFHARLVQVH